MVSDANNMNLFINSIYRDNNTIVMDKFNKNEKFKSQYIVIYDNYHGKINILAMNKM